MGVRFSPLYNRTITVSENTPKTTRPHPVFLSTSGVVAAFVMSSIWIPATYPPVMLPTLALLEWVGDADVNILDAVAAAIRQVATKSMNCTWYLRCCHHLVTWSGPSHFTAGGQQEAKHLSRTVELRLRSRSCSYRLPTHRRWVTNQAKWEERERGGSC